MKAIDHCLVVWRAFIISANRNDQEREHTQFFMLDYVRVLFKSRFFGTTEDERKPFFTCLGLFL